MFRTIRLIAVVYAIVFLSTYTSTVSAADHHTIMVTIKPFYNLCAKVMQDVGTPTLLLKGNASPHDYHLKPSDAQLIKDSTLVIWGGPDLDGYLQKPLQSIGNGKDLDLSKIKKLKLLPLRTDTHWHSHDDHDHHHHGSFDPHFWLDPANAIVIVNAIAARLTELDPAHAKVYAKNAHDFAKEIKAKDIAWKQKLKPVQHTPYIVFHDAYQYFNAAFGLDGVGSISLNPEIPPSVQRITQIQDLLEHDNVQCIFSEPQFDFKIIDTLTNGLNVYKGKLDPLGQDIDLGPNGYFDLIDDLVHGFVLCGEQAN